MESRIPKENDIDRKWYVIDATDKVLGRLATEVARIIRGKNKAYFTPHLDTGDFVVVVNAEKIKVTGKKMLLGQHKRYSGYPGGLRTTTWGEVLQKNPEKLIEHAVKGMLPKNRLGRRLFKKLHVYIGPEHNHQAQKPEPYEFE